MSAVDDAVTEMQAAVKAMEPVHEGFRDFSRLNLHPDTADVVNRAIHEYDQRLGLLNSALAALTQLQDNGYPALPPHEVTPEVLEDLRNNTATIEAALQTFTGEKASLLGLTAGTPEMKSETKTETRSKRG